jgi:hypothetical protein
VSPLEVLVIAYIRVEPWREITPAVAARNLHGHRVSEGMIVTYAAMLDDEPGDRLRLRRGSDVLLENDDL